jgi:hypothetical protein
VEVLDYWNQLFDNLFEHLLVLNVAFREVGVGAVLHNNEANSLLAVVVESLIKGYLRVLQSLDVQENFPCFLNLLLLQFSLLDSKDSSSCLFLAFVNTGIATLSKFFQKMVFCVKGLRTSDFHLFRLGSLGLRKV